MRKLNKTERKICQNQIKIYEDINKGLAYDTGTCKRDIEIGLDIKLMRAKAQAKKQLKEMEEELKQNIDIIKTLKNQIKHGVQEKEVK